MRTDGADPPRLCSLGDAFAVRGLAPEAIDIDHVFADAGDGYLQKALALGGFEKNPLLLGQSMPDASIPDLATGRLAATESFDVILVGLGHRQESKAEGKKSKCGSVLRSRVSAIGYGCLGSGAGAGISIQSSIQSSILTDRFPLGLSN